MRIFISGVAGFLGSHLADAFLKEGHEVVGCDKLIGGYNQCMDLLRYQFDYKKLHEVTKIITNNLSW